MKKIVALFLSLVIIIGLMPTAFAASGPILELKSDKTIVKKGDIVTLKFNIKNNSGFGSVRAVIKFDNTLLTLTAQEKTYKPGGNYQDIGLGTPISSANKKGFLVVWYSPNLLGEGKYTKPIKYEGTYAIMKFVAKRSGKTSFSFDKTELYMDDAKMTKVSHDLKVTGVIGDKDDNKTSSKQMAGNKTNKTPEIKGDKIDDKDKSEALKDSNLTNNKETLKENEQEDEKRGPTYDKDYDTNLILIIFFSALAVIIAAAFLVRYLILKKRKNK